MKKWLKRQWRAFLYPIFGTSISLLAFGVVLFHYYYFGKDHPFYKLMEKEQVMLILMLAYSPLILFIAFARMPDLKTRLRTRISVLSDVLNSQFWSLAAFASTLLAIAIMEMAYLSGIRRPDVLDILQHTLAVTQLAVLTFRMLGSFMGQLSDSDGVAMDITPEPIKGLIVLAWVPAITLVLDKYTELRPHSISEIVYLGGIVLLMIMDFKKSRKEI